MRQHAYDAAGNVTSDGAHTYTYDGEHRLTQVDGGGSIAYGYDYANRRIKKVSGGAVTHYVWEGSEVLGEFNAGTGAHLADYVQAGGRQVARLASGVVTWYLSDRLSVRLLLDNGGAVVGRQGHLPYGEEVGTSGQQEKRRFTSYERDAETGLDYAVNRYYAPGIGRFASVDPVLDQARTGKAGGCGSGYLANLPDQQRANPQHWDGYTYSLNDPVNKIDPLGLTCFSIFGEDIGEILIDRIPIPSQIVDFLCNLNPIPSPGSQGAPGSPCDNCCSRELVLCLLAAGGCATTAAAVLANQLQGCRQSICKTGTREECKQCKQTAKLVFEIAMIGCGLAFVTCDLNRTSKCKSEDTQLPPPDDKCDCGLI